MQINPADKHIGYWRFTIGSWLYAWWEALVLAVVALAAIALATSNLALYPAISGWDEGMYLQFADNLVRYGEYATRNGQVFERLQPVGGTGPTLIAPVALALWLSSQSLAAARLVIVAYLLCTLAGGYLLARRLSGQAAGIAGIPLFLIAGYGIYDTLWMGRQVLAELPGFAFLLLGLWAWIRSWRGTLRWLITSGALVGLAVITKNQLIWVLGPSFVVFGLIDWVYYRQLRWTHSLMPLAGVVAGYGAWVLLSLWIVGPEDRLRYLDTQRALTAATFLHVGPQRWIENARLLYTSGQATIAVLSIGYGLYRARTRSLIGVERLVLPLFASAALASFLIMSLPWARYLYPALALAALCSALLVGDLVVWVRNHGPRGDLWVAGALVLAVGVLSGTRIVQNVQRIATADDQSAARFSEIVDLQVPAGARVMNWEWELEFYTQRPMIHPPHRLFAALIDQTYNLRGDPVLDQPRIPADIDYLIVGPFADQTQVFATELAARRHQLVGSEGPYRLYLLDR
jgi:4-amino-4-deoxy-L-arabinose transferase-like glycosyltransferase